MPGNHRPTGLPTPSPVKRVPVPLSSELTLASSPRAAADARRWVGDICVRLDRTTSSSAPSWASPSWWPTPILHATAPFKVRVRGTASHPRIEVIDGSTSPPVPPDPARRRRPRPAADLRARAVDGGPVRRRLGRDDRARRQDRLVRAGAQMSDEGRRRVGHRPPRPHRAPSRPARTRSTMQPHSASTSRSTPRSSRQYHELRRELRLLSLSHQSDYPLAGDLTSMFANFERQFPDAFRRADREPRRRAGCPRVDVTFRMVPRGGPDLRDDDRDVRRRRRLLPRRAAALAWPARPPARVPQLAPRRAGPPARRATRRSRGTATAAPASSSTSQVG